MAKIDEGFRQSEKMLNELEAKIHKEYAQASKEMADKATAYFNRFKSKDLEQRDRYESGEISKKEYTEWRKRQMATGKRYIAMRDTLAKDLTNTDKIAMKMVNQALPDVYALNMNYGTYSIEKDSKINTSFTLYNHAAVERLIKDNPKLLPNPKVDIPKDLRWNQQHIQSAITQGILQGKSIPKIAKDLQRVAGMDENAAIRNARTAMTGAQNGGRLDSMKRAAARGIGVKKGWLSTLDNVTRDSHVDLDGEVQEIDRPFSNGLMYPGDASGIPAEVYNCRCRLTHEYDKYKTDWSNPANRNTSKMGNMSYDEWKNRHKGKATKIVAKEAAKNAQTIVKVTTKAEALESLKAIFTDVDEEVMKLNEELFVDNVNRITELNERFGAIPKDNGSYFSVNNSKQKIAYVQGGYRDGKYELSISNKFYKKSDDLIASYERGQKKFFKMPSTDDYKTTYTITHEYGHILEAAISRKRTDFEELKNRISMFNPAIQGQEYRKAEEIHANIIRDEIIGIAKENNPNFVLENNLSRYGHANSYEFFAEVFANSQCGAPNELGMAMQQWLIKEGF